MNSDLQSTRAVQDTTTAMIAVGRNGQLPIPLPPAAQTRGTDGTSDWRRVAALESLRGQGGLTPLDRQAVQSPQGPGVTELAKAIPLAHD